MEILETIEIEIELATHFSYCNWNTFRNWNCNWLADNLEAFKCQYCLFSPARWMLINSPLNVRIISPANDLILFEVLWGLRIRFFCSAVHSSTYIGLFYRKGLYIHPICVCITIGRISLISLYCKKPRMLINSELVRVFVHCNFNSSDMNFIVWWWLRWWTI